MSFPPTDMSDKQVRVNTYFNRPEQLEVIDATCMACGKNILHRESVNDVVTFNKFEACQCKPVPPFDVTDEMRENDKFGEAVLHSDRADKAIDIDEALKPKLHGVFFDNEGYVCAKQPMTPNPESPHPVA